MTSIVWSLFPKFYQHLSIERLAELVQQVGLDTTNLVIRDGYWVSQKAMAADLPRFMRAMDAAGLKVRFATAGFSASEVVADPGLVQILRDWGITEFRLGHFAFNASRPVRTQLLEARQQMDALASVCDRVGIRAVYQVHHDTLISSASAVSSLFKGLPIQAVSVELDPGNQSYEGLENWDYAFGLLGERVTAAGIKDTGLVRCLDRANEANKGWIRDWMPIDEGVTNWSGFTTALLRADFNGTFVFMPFYHENDPEKMTAALTREVAYLRGIVAQVSFNNV